MKKTLFLILSLFLGTAESADWKQFGLSNNGDSFYYEQGRGNTIWVLNNFGYPDKYGTRSTVYVYTADCKRGELITIQGQGYSGLWAAADTTFRGRQEIRDSVRPGTITENVYLLLCEK